MSLPFTSAMLRYGCVRGGHHGARQRQGGETAAHTERKALGSCPETSPSAPEMRVPRCREAVAGVDRCGVRTLLGALCPLSLTHATNKQKATERTPGLAGHRRLHWAHPRVPGAAPRARGIQPRSLLPLQAEAVSPMLTPGLLQTVPVTPAWGAPWVPGLRGADGSLTSSHGCAGVTRPARAQLASKPRFSPSCLAGKRFYIQSPHVSATKTRVLLSMPAGRPHGPLAPGPCLTSPTEGGSRTTLSLSPNTSGDLSQRTS